jgi:hypothetical protein
MKNEGEKRKEKYYYLIAVNTFFNNTNDKIK